MKIYDITATISDDLPVYGDERFTVNKVASIKTGDKFNFTKFAATTHTGTHADMPSHFIADGATCDNIDLSHFYGRAKLIRIAATAHVTKEDLLTYDIPEGIILLIDLGQSKDMSRGTMNKNFLALMPCAAHYLVEKRVKTVGIDCLSVDPYGDDDYPAHMTLLGNGIAILEGLVLDSVPEGEYTLCALPLKFHEGDGSPVRAVLTAL